MKVSCGNICAYLREQGLSVELFGDQNRIVEQPCALSLPKSGALTFYRPKRWDQQEPDLSKVDFLITTDEVRKNMKSTNDGITLFIVENPRLSFILAVSHFFIPKIKAGIHPLSSIHHTAQVDSTASIGAFVEIGAKSTVGANTRISANVTIGEDVSIGNDCFVGPSASLGQPGFGYERDQNGVLVQFPHIGGIQIGNNVHIGANTTVDRGTLQDTVIADRVRIDNLCHIAHNVEIGADTAIIANSMIGGSVIIGEGSWIAPSASLINGISVGSQSLIGMGAVVVKPVTDGQKVAGSPARDLEEFKVLQKTLKNLHR